MGTLRCAGSKWLRIAALSAGVVAAIAGCASAGSEGGSQPAATTAATTAATKAAGQSGPGATPVAKRSGTLLAAVGKGWTLAEYSAAAASDGEPGRAGVTALYLVSPQGARTVLYRWPAASQPGWRLIDWSGDKSRALFAGQTPNAVGQLDLATRKFTRFTLPGGTQAISYSRPGGTAILATQQTSRGDKILRYDLNGNLEKTLATGPQNAANVAVYAPDGTTLAVNGAKALELVRNSGGGARSLPVPGHPTCQPVRWWNAGTILATCLAPGHVAPRLWLVPASGAQPTALTPQRDGSGPDLGDIDAWRLPSGLYLQAASGCGVIYIAKQASDGSAVTVNVPQTTGNDNQIVTADGAKLLVRAQTSCEPSSSLLWFTPATNVVQMLMHAPSGVQGVIAAVAYKEGS